MSRSRAKHPLAHACGSAAEHAGAAEPFRVARPEAVDSFRIDFVRRGGESDASQQVFVAQFWPM
jgi:hypothetical protein